MLRCKTKLQIPPGNMTGMRVHLYMPAARNRAPGYRSQGAPRPAFWMSASEAGEHLRPLMHEKCCERFDSWRKNPRMIEGEALDGRWAFLVPARPISSDPPIFFFHVFPYSAMNSEKNSYRRIPGEEPYDERDHPCLRGVEIKDLSELEALLDRFQSSSLKPVSVTA